MCLCVVFFIIYLEFKFSWICESTVFCRNVLNLANCFSLIFPVLFVSLLLDLNYTYVRQLNVVLQFTDTLNLFFSLFLSVSFCIVLLLCLKVYWSSVMSNLLLILSSIFFYFRHYIFLHWKCHWICSLSVFSASFFYLEYI